MGLAVAEDCGHVVFRPLNQRIDVGEERACAVGDAVFHPWRHFGVDGARHEAVGLKSAEGVCEHLLRYVGNLAAQSAEAHGRP